MGKYTKIAVFVLLAFGTNRLLAMDEKATFKIDDIIRDVAGQENFEKTVDFSRYNEITVNLPRALVTMGNTMCWEFSSATGPVALVSSCKQEAEPGLAGSAGTDVFTFKITKTGSATIEFAHVVKDPSGRPVNAALYTTSVKFNITIK